MVGTGFVIGVISGCLCFMILLTIGVTKQIFNRIRGRIANPFIQEVLPPLIGGLAIGTYVYVCWCICTTAFYVDLVVKIKYIYFILCAYVYLMQY